jgi:hypothetical protein
MKKMIIIFIGLISLAFSALLITWVLPVKHSIELDDLETYANGSVVLLCQGAQITGSLWRVVDYYGVSSAPTHIDTTGADFNSALKGKTYNYLSNDFIFVGEFSDENSETFITSRWEVVGKITRAHELIPFPSNYFNMWEIQR